MRSECVLSMEMCVSCLMAAREMHRLNNSFCLLYRHISAQFYCKTFTIHLQKQWMSYWMTIFRKLFYSSIILKYNPNWQESLEQISPYSHFHFHFHFHLFLVLFLQNLWHCQFKRNKNCWAYLFNVSLPTEQWKLFLFVRHTLLSFDVYF